MTEQGEPTAVNGAQNVGEGLVMPQSGPPLPVAQFPVNAVQLMSNGSDVLIIASQMMALAGSAPALGANPVCTLLMSKVVAKELMVVLQETVEHLEKDFGQIDSPFLKSRAGSK